MADDTQPNRGGLFSRIGAFLRGEDYHTPSTLGKDIGRKGDFAYDTSMQWQSSNWSSPSLLGTSGNYGTRTNYAVSAGDLIDNSAVMACLLWIVRTFTQVPIHMTRRNPDGEPEVLQEHPVAELLAHPNPYYAGPMLWRSTLISLNWNGNGYWRKGRNGLGRTIRLFYEPHWTIRPRRTSSDDYISFYEIWRNRAWQRIETSEIVHFRNGLDPNNDMLGLSDLASALRHVYTDNEASRYTATLLMNMGVPGPIFSPKTDEAGDSMNLGTAQKFVQLWQEKTTGDNRGQAIALTVPVDVSWPTVDPSKMATKDMHHFDETRIAALLGVPAVVAQLGAGLEHSTFNNFASAIRMAYTSNIIPTMQLVSSELDIQLLPEFGDATQEDVVFDMSSIAELQESKKDDKIQDRLAAQAGIIFLNEARATFGRPPIEGGDITLPEYLAQRGVGGAPPAMGDKGVGWPQEARIHPRYKARSMDSWVDRGGFKRIEQPSPLLMLTEGKALTPKEKLERRMGRAVKDYIEGEYRAVAAHLES